MTEPSLRKNFVLSMAYQVLLLIVPFITAPYVSRVLTVDGIGIYSFTNSVQMYFAMFAALGTSSYGAREIARHRNDREQRSKIFWEIEFLSVLTTAICLFLYIVFITITKEYRIYYTILGVNLLSVALDISWFYTGMEQFKFTIGPNAVLKFLGVVAIFIFVKVKDDLALYILIMSLVVFFGNITMWVYLPRLIGRVRIKELSIGSHFRETLVYFLPTIATSVYTVLDKTLIGLITSNTSENGYYEQATKIVNMAKTLTFTSLNTLLGARMSYLFAANRQDEIKERINSSIDYILFMGFGLCFGISAIAPRLVPSYFGDGYIPVINLLYWLSPIIIIIGISNCLGSQYYTPAGLRAKSAKYIIIGSAVNLIMNIILIPLYRSKGAVLATIIAETTISILYIHNSINILEYKMIAKQMWKKIFAGFTMLYIIRIIDKSIQKNLYAICIEVIVGFILYCLILVVIKDSFPNRCLKMLRKVIEVK